MLGSSIFSVHPTDHIINTLLPLIRNHISDHIIFTRAISSTVCLQNIIECPVYQDYRLMITRYLIKTAAYLVILTVELPAFDRMNSRRSSMRFQYFSHPLHSAYIERWNRYSSKIFCIKSIQITHHKRYTST